jgi:hypothetical protein
MDNKEDKEKPVVQLSKIVSDCEEFWWEERGYILIVPNSSRESYEMLAGQLSARQIGFYIDFRRTYMGRDLHQHIVDLKSISLKNDMAEQDFLGK